MTIEELFAQAQTQIEKGDFEAFNATKKAIEDAQTKDKQAAEAKASLQAMMAEPKGMPINSGAAAVNLTGVSAMAKATDIYATDEYRYAFKDSVMTGAAIPAKFVNANATTTTGDVGSVIPTPTMNRIIEKLETSGKIWSRISKSSYPAGVNVPTSTVKPVATWVAERATSDTQSKTTGTISFKANKLICKVAISLEVSVMTLEMFETKLVENVASAMLKAMEKSCVSGTGSGQPKGILTETVPTGHNINIAKTASATFADVAKAEAALPLAYDGAVWNMSKSTFMNVFLGMVDADGRPIMKEIFGTNGKPNYFILGREVVLLEEDIIAGYAATVSADTVFAFMYDWKDYLGNTNYQMGIREYIDEATDDKIKKSIMLFDGKALDINSLVTLTKKSS